MKKYRLIKGFPGINKGCLAAWDEDANAYKIEMSAWVAPYRYYWLSKGQVEQNQDWFEEVKDERKRRGCFISGELDCQNCSFRPACISEVKTVKDEPNKKVKDHSDLCKDCIRNSCVVGLNSPIFINGEYYSPFDAIKYAQKCSQCKYDGLVSDRKKQDETKLGIDSWVRLNEWDKWSEELDEAIYKEILYQINLAKQHGFDHTILKYSLEPLTYDYTLHRLHKAGYCINNHYRLAKKGKIKSWCKISWDRPNKCRPEGRPFGKWEHSGRNMGRRGIYFFTLNSEDIS